MITEELVRKSPMRILENSMHGGLGKGKIGVLASRKGVGKTACLVHIAIDRLLQEKAVIHVSFSSRVDHIMTWYEHIFSEMAKNLGLESEPNLLDEIIKNRVIMNFSQKGTPTGQVLRSLEALIKNGRFPAETVIVDGFSFPQSSPDDLQKFRDLAERLGLEVWFSASLKKEDPLFDDRGNPYELECCLGQIDVLMTLQHRQEKVYLRLIKEHGIQSPVEVGLILDPKTLLLVET